MPLFFLSTLIAVSCYLFGAHIWRLTFHYYCNSRLLHKYGCLRPRKYPHWDPFLGYDLYLKFKKSLKNGTFLHDTQLRHEIYGKTFQFNAMGTDNIRAIEPENLKAIFSTHFECFGKAVPEQTPMTKLLGRGIMSANGILGPLVRSYRSDIY